MIIRFLTTIAICLFSWHTFSQTIPNKPEDISPLLIGEDIPSAELKYPDGSTVKLSDLLRKRKTILIFYRGGWCPYCNAHLADVAKIEDKLIALGYQIIAISPDAPQLLKSTEAKNSIHYTLLSDQSGGLIRKMGLAFKAPAYNEKDLIQSQPDKAAQFLPVPSLFILTKKGEILFEHINPNFKSRINGYILLSAAKAFAESNE